MCMLKEGYRKLLSSYLSNVHSSLVIIIVPWQVSIVHAAFETDVLLITKEDEEDFPKWMMPNSQFSSDIDNMGSLIVAVRENSCKS